MTVLLVATRDGLTAVEGPAPPPLEGGVTALARAAGALLAVTDGERVWGAERDGWAPLAAADGLTLTCLLRPADGPVYVGASEGRLLRLEGGELEPVASFDDAPGRDAWYTPWGGPPDVRSLSADPAGTVYANVHVGGVLRSDDEGATWTPTIDVDADVHQVLAHPDETEVVVAATARGLAMSEDGGGSWSFHTEGLHAPYSRAVAVAGGTVLVSASVGPFGGRAALYRFDRRGFRRCVDGLPEWFDGNLNTHCVAGAGTLAAFGTGDGRVFLSRDAGETWEQVGEGLGEVTAVLLTAA